VSIGVAGAAVSRRPCLRPALIYFRDKETANRVEKGWAVCVPLGVGGWLEFAGDQRKIDRSLAQP